ncbi:MAG TPA: NAD(P)H-dependent oxidoreductase [Polyangiaceae bacterium]|nr:NAD(P)H-dependent oxidoreductase [Polyangiaceae bacterium]
MSQSTGFGQDGASAGVVFVAGSPSADSRSQKLLLHLQERLNQRSVGTQLFAVRDFPGQALIGADTTAPAVKQFVDAVKLARAIVLATPVYKATYAGALKALIDLIPQDALVGKSALAVATAREPAHFITTRRAFDDLFAFFRLGRTLRPVFLLDAQVHSEAGRAIFDAEVEVLLSTAADELLLPQPAQTRALKFHAR